MASIALMWLIVFSSDAVTRSQEKHKVTLADLQSLQGIDYSTLSPDGGMLAYTAYTPDMNVWLTRTRLGSRPRKIGEGFLPVWSPNGRWLAYYSRKSKTLQLWVLDLEANRAKQVTHFTGGIKPEPWTQLNGWTYDPFRYSWSPDSNYLILASMARTEVGSTVETHNVGKEPGVSSKASMPLVLTSTTPAESTLSGIVIRGFISHRDRNAPHSDNPHVDSGSRQRVVNQLFIVELRTSSVRQLTHDEAIYFNPDWSPDGKTIVCASADGRSSAGRITDTTNIYAISIASGAKTAVTKGAGVKRLPLWSPDGTQIAYMQDGLFKIQAVFVIPAAGGDPTNVTSRLQRYVLGFAWSANGKSIIVSYQDGTTDPIARVDVSGFDIIPIAAGNYVARYSMTTATSRSGDVTWAQGDPTNEGVIHILAADGTNSRVLVDLNSQIRDWELGAQEVVRWKNRRGDDMEGVLLKPVGYHVGRRYPLIVDAYPGQVNGFKGSAMSGNQAWASMGYAVFWPNARAPHVWMNPFKSAAFDQAAKGPQGWDITTDDVVSGVDELINRGIVDPNRMCLYGFSNGGGVVNYLVTRTSRFKCAVSVAGALSNWVRPTLLETDSMIPAFEGGSDPWHDPEAYIQLSAVFHTANVRTPMLLAVGDEDGDFLLDTVEMYNGLRRFGCDVTLLRYPNQGHGFTGAAARDFWGREMAFFDNYLKPERAN